MSNSKNDEEDFIFLPRKLLVARRIIAAKKRKRERVGREGGRERERDTLFENFLNKISSSRLTSSGNRRCHSADNCFRPIYSNLLV
jgi:hypothetical protein